MAPFGEVEDFYIAPLQHAVSDTPTWLVSVGFPGRCIGVHDALADAIKQAVKSAHYRLLAGYMTQVHVKQEEGAAWRTVWHHPEGAMPRFSNET